MKRPTSSRRRPPPPFEDSGPEPSARLKTSEPSDFVVLVPYLLGFHPTESLVALFFKGKTKDLTARVDLVPRDKLDLLVEQLMFIAGSQDVDRVILVSYSRDQELANATLDAVAEALPLEVIDALYADGSRWWSRVCSSSDCCPPEGTPYVADTHPLVAEAVFAGLSVAGSREEMAELADGPPDDDTEELARTTERIRQEVKPLGQPERAAMIAKIVATHINDPADLSDETCARLAVLCVDLVVRDVAWSLMTRQNATHHVDLWHQVVARTVAPYESAPLCLLGMAAWISGNGALQVCCMQRMQDVNRRYGLLRILEDINDRALSPSWWDTFALEMRAEIGQQAS